MKGHEKILSLVQKIKPTRITGYGNVIVYPSPPEVVINLDLANHKPYAEAFLPLKTKQKLNFINVNQAGTNAEIALYEADVKFPTFCYLCHRDATDHIIVETCSRPKLSGRRLQINAPNAAYLWRALISDRYWYPIPVCDRHNNLNEIQKNLKIVTNEYDGEVLFRFPSLIWTKEFLELNEVTYANYKNKEYHVKNLIRNILLYLCILFPPLGIAMLIREQKWGMFIFSIPIVIGAFYLLFTNKYEHLVGKVETDENASFLERLIDKLDGLVVIEKFAKNLVAYGQAIVVTGVLFLFLKINDTPMPFIGIGLIALGGILFGLGFLIKKVKKIE